MSEHLVFVYGSLKKGFHNHKLLENSEFIGEALTTPIFNMHSLGGFPAVVKGNHRILGELYVVDDITFKKLDRLEANGSMYHREQTPIYGIDIDAWIYIFLHKVPDRNDGQVITSHGIQTWEEISNYCN